MNSALPLVIDIGMYDAADTQYYLETGHQVIAVEAHPGYVKHAERLLQQYVQTGRLTILNFAVASSSENRTLNLHGFNPGGHSIVQEAVGCMPTTGALHVAACTMADILKWAPQRAKLIKIDIEGADLLCLEGLDADHRPDFLSCEMHDGLADCMPHLIQLGFTRFKLVDQTTFRELSQGQSLLDRVALGLLRRVGYCEPQSVRRAGRWFATGFSSGPAPWESGGRWWRSAEVLAQFDAFKRSCQRNVWLDLHAC